MILKTYLILAVITLMGITSLGIFGFLTSAYQQSHVKVEIVDTKKAALDSTKQTLSDDISNLNKRIEVLNKAREQQEKRVLDSGNYKAPREQAYAAIEKTNIEVKELQEKIDEKTNNISSLQTELLSLKVEETKSTDIGTLKFVSILFNKDISTIVKWFTIIIVLVFDPLAISLVLAYNNIVSNKEVTVFEKKENILNFFKKKVFKKQAVNANYRL